MGKMFCVPQHTHAQALAGIILATVILISGQFDRYKITWFVRVQEECSPPLSPCKETQADGDSVCQER